VRTQALTEGMIAKLYGRIDETGVDSLVIDVNGVGYLV
jgi:holliday junction DNA helicase RuvA